MCACDSVAVLQIAKSLMRVFQEVGGDQHLVAEQVCPSGVADFPHHRLQVLCWDSSNCGNVSSPPSIPGQSRTTPSETCIYLFFSLVICCLLINYVLLTTDVALLSRCVI